MTELAMTVGVPIVATVTPPPSGETWTAPATVALPGVSWKPSRTNALRLEGTPTTAGTTTIDLVGDDGYGSGVGRQTVNVTVSAPVEIDATVPETPLPIGEPVDVDLTPLFSLTDTRFIVSGTLPPGLAVSPSAVATTALVGTVAEFGAWPITLQGRDDAGDYTDTFHELTLTVSPPVVVIPAPAAESTEDGYMLPEVEGVRWTVNGAETAPGTYSVQPVTETTTVTIIPEALEGYEFDPEAVPLVLTFDPAPDPDPDPDPDPWEPPARPAGDYPGPWPTPAPGPPTPEDEAVWQSLMDDDPQAMFVATKLAERIIVHVGRDVADMDPAEVLTARDHAMVILEYVKGYTRDRGFVGYAPHRSIQAVIVSAAARLFTNPEQLTFYSTGDYSERPATMTGWTAAELGVLRRFRKVYA